MRTVRKRSMGPDMERRPSYPKRVAVYGVTVNPPPGGASEHYNRSVKKHFLRSLCDPFTAFI